MKITWACPKCKADANAHGEKRCLNGTRECQGFLCECDDDTDEAHGTTFTDPCTQANCYHCGWGGTFPVKPKGLLAWEKKALEAGWAMPEARQRELALPSVSEEKKA